MKIIDELREFGLSENEVKVYLACLGLGKAKVNEISKKSNLIRTTTYGLLKSPGEKGLISKFDKDKITFFQPANPKEIINILEEKKRNISNILPELEELTSLKQESYNVELFEGERGVKTILNEAISAKGGIIKVIGAAQGWVKFAKEYIHIYYRKKKENKVQSLTLVDDTKENRKVFREEELKTNAKIKFSKGVCLENSAMIIYGKKVAFVNYEKNNLRGFVVKDPYFSIIQNNLFDKVWKSP